MKHAFYLAILAAILIAASCGKEDTPCPNGFIGEDCDIPVAPTFITITRLTVSGWPMTRPNGSGWDANGTGPDIQLVLVAEGTGQTLHTSGVADNVATNAPRTITGTWRLSPGQQNIAVFIYDDDELLGRELITSAAYPAWSATTGRPATISFTREGTLYVLDVLYEQ